MYVHKRLDLPGIGTFFVNEPVHSETESRRHDKMAGIEIISFESNPATKQNPDLVQFIADQTGKIKALASADLESHLALARQFLNIGNPFLFEGIGNLIKIRSGEYAFTPVPGTHEKTKENSFRDKPGSRASGEFDYKKNYSPGNVKAKWRKPLVIFLIIAGLAFSVWGGYLVYKKTTEKNTTVSDDKNKNEITDTAYGKMDRRDTFMNLNNTNAGPVQDTPAGIQKFILEVCDSNKANKRYNLLKRYQWDIHREKKDSVSYQLFLLLPASASDTSHIIDSLSRLYGKRAYVEHKEK